MSDVPPAIGPTEAVILALLEQNDRRVQGLTRLDQQLVYLPLVGLGAAISVALANSHAVKGIVSSEWVCAGALLVWVLVAAGLGRNHCRHVDLLGDRARLMTRLGVQFRDGNDWKLGMGRGLFFALFSVGLWAEAFALSRIVG